MAALAGMLKDRGYEITGSDENVYPPMSTFLEAKGIPVYNKFDPAHLQPAPDLVIIGNAMSRGNAEVEYVLNHQIRYASIAEALKKYFIRGKYSCVVAGTHGKTTTTSLFAWILESAGLNPGFFVGGLPENFGQGYQLGTGRHFVLEGDEYDTAFFDKAPKFLHYLPNLVILNNIEFDHADIYSGFDAVKLSYQRLINIIPGNGHLIACSDDPVVMELSKRAFCNVVTFGIEPQADWQACELSLLDKGTQFFVKRKEERYGPFFIPMWGEHNIKNATAVLAASQQLGVPLEKVQEAFQQFKGVRRRLQTRLENRFVTVMDDFAHHPTEVKATLKTIRAKYPQKNIWAVFEPRTATTKRKLFEKDYIQAFAEVNSVVFAPLHRPDKVPAEERLSLETVAEKIRSQGKQVEIMAGGEIMATFLAEQISTGDVVVFMSNGDFQKTPDLLVKKLASKFTE